MWAFPVSCCWMRQELRVQSWTPSTVLMTEVINAVNVHQTGSATLGLCFTLNFVGTLKFHRRLNMWP